MTLDHLPLRLLRFICGQPAMALSPQAESEMVSANCAPDNRPTVAVVVPGIGDSGDRQMLAPLVHGLWTGLGPMASLVTIVPVRWTLDKDIASYAVELNALISNISQHYDGHRMALIGFSLGGTAALYALACATTSGQVWRHDALVVTLASPANGSERYQRAVEEWKRTPAVTDAGRLELVAAQLRHDSPVMASVRTVLSQHDVHLITVKGDGVVDGAAACPPWYHQVLELDVGVSSVLRRHFDLPRQPVVIDAVVSTLLDHIGCARWSGAPLVGTGAESR